MIFRLHMLDYAFYSSSVFSNLHTVFMHVLDFQNSSSFLAKWDCFTTVSGQQMPGHWAVSGMFKALFTTTGGYC